MGSHTELDELAKNLWKEGDKEGLKVLCKENGIEYEDVTDAAEEGITLWITPTMAARGRIGIQKEASKLPDEAKAVIYNMAMSMAAEPRTSFILMKKGKRMDDIWKELEKIARRNQKGGCGVACGTDRELKKIILDYYGGQA